MASSRAKARWSAPVLADAAAVVAQPLRHRLEDAPARLLLKGDHEIGPHHQAQLLSLDALLLAAIDHLGDDEEIRVVVLDLGPLGVALRMSSWTRIWMPNSSPSLRPPLHLLQAIDVDPGDAGGQPGAKGFLDGGQPPLAQPLPVVVHQVELHRPGLLLADVHQGAGGQAGLVRFPSAMSWHERTPWRPRSTKGRGRSAAAARSDQKA